MDAADALRSVAIVQRQQHDPVAAAIPLPEAMPLAGLAPAERLEIRRRVKVGLARAYLNLGIMHAQAGRFIRAAEFFEEAAGIDAMFPQVQYSLRVAYFNAQRFDRAVAPLSHALEGDLRLCNNNQADLRVST